jgi:hypothetical protein
MYSSLSKLQLRSLLENEFDRYPDNPTWPIVDSLKALLDHAPSPVSTAVILPAILPSAAAAVAATQAHYAAHHPAQQAKASSSSSMRPTKRQRTNGELATAFAQEGEALEESNRVRWASEQASLQAQQDSEKKAMDERHAKATRDAHSRIDAEIVDEIARVTMAISAGASSESCQECEETIAVSDSEENGLHFLVCTRCAQAVCEDHVDSFSKCDMPNCNRVYCSLCSEELDDGCKHSGPE